MIFLGPLGIQTVIGHRFPGGFIGDLDERQNFVIDKVLQ